MLKLSVKLLGASAVACAMYASPAMAQATRTWVSGVGDDANPCSRTAPCKTFAGAISKTAASGEINCIDPGGFGGLTITKSITVRCGFLEAGVLVSGTNGFTVNAASTDRVVIDGLDFEGLTTGLSGVNILQARYVLITNSAIRGFTNSGVLVNSSNKTRVTVTNTQMIGNGWGVRVTSTDGKSAVVMTNNTITGSLTAGVETAGGAGNSVSMSNNSVTDTPNSLVIGAGTNIYSYGDNVLSSGATPTPTPHALPPRQNVDVQMRRVSC